MLEIINVTTGKRWRFVMGDGRASPWQRSNPKAWTGPEDVTHFIEVEDDPDV